MVVHFGDWRVHDGIDAAVASSLPFGRGVNPGLQGAAALGLL